MGHCTNAGKAAPVQRWHHRTSVGTIVAPILRWRHRSNTEVTHVVPALAPSHQCSVGTIAPALARPHIFGKLPKTSAILVKTPLLEMRKGKQSKNR